MALDESGYFDQLSRAFEAWCVSRGLDSDDYSSFVAYMEYMGEGPDEDEEHDAYWASLN